MQTNKNKKDNAHQKLAQRLYTVMWGKDDAFCFLNAAFNPDQGVLDDKRRQQREAARWEDGRPLCRLHNLSHLLGCRLKSSSPPLTDSGIWLKLRPSGESVPSLKHLFSVCLFVPMLTRTLTLALLLMGEKVQV